MSKKSFIILLFLTLVSKVIISLKFVKIKNRYNLILAAFASIQLIFFSSISVAQDSQLTKLDFKKNTKVSEKFFSKNLNKSHDGIEFFYVEYDLNQDGVNEYLVKLHYKGKYDENLKCNYDNCCPRSDMPTCLEFGVYDNQMKSISTKFGGYKDLSISGTEENNYLRLFLKCSNKKWVTLFFDPEYKKYADKVGESCF